MSYMIMLRDYFVPSIDNISIHLFDRFKRAVAIINNVFMPEMSIADYKVSHGVLLFIVP